MNVSDFDFLLPAALIAQEAAPRGSSRLLVLDRSRDGLTHASIRDLPRWLRQGDVLVANDTRVFPARLLGRRVPSGGAVECLLLSRTGDEAGAQIWDALVHPGQKLKEGSFIRFEGPAGALTAEVLARHFHGRRTIRLRADAPGRIDDLVDALGHVPLPPYIHRPDTTSDRDRYQTIFASRRGSVAAPTAGLHFDDDLLCAIDAAGVLRTTITLHVGYGTFKPVRTDVVEEHVVDAEHYEISPAAATAINAALDERRRVIAIGTTTTRALEDAAMKGEGRVAAGRGEAGIFIYPGFDFKVVGGLVTNFHLPKSSLLMLVAAFAGRERLLRAYQEAVEQQYRFYSYGDAMLVV
ncbi:MAG TPA: tRNA preQ1(34) S-adenosylmethionine ribosyltransferase-isomerase QueA [Gemmatimonadaceae bacterium]